jgi:uncharacterized protein (UPF0332 family)
MTQPSRLFAKAGRALRSAENLLTAGYSEDATAIASFAWFYTAWGLLLASGFGPFRHDQVRALFRRHFTETGVLDPSYSMAMERAYQLRLIADFETDPIDSKDTIEVVAGGKDFLAAASRYLDEHPGSGEGDG